MEKTALITGASSGLGLCLAKIFAREGYNVVLVARSEEKLNELKAEIESKYKKSAYVCPADLSSADSARKIFEFTEQNKLSVDVLVNNAGFGDFGPFAESDLNKQTQMIAVNITALTQLCHLYMNPMIKRGSGKILNIASIAAFQAGPLMSVYYATKAFVLSLTEALSVELKGTGVTATVVCPGPIKTGFEDSARLENSGLFKHLKNSTAEEVAEFSFKALMKNKLIAIHGAGNRVTVTASKFAPRRLVRYVAYLIQK